MNCLSLLTTCLVLSLATSVEAGHYTFYINHSTGDVTVSRSACDSSKVVYRNCCDSSCRSRMNSCSGGCASIANSCDSSSAARCTSGCQPVPSCESSRTAPSCGSTCDKSYRESPCVCDDCSSGGNAKAAPTACEQNESTIEDNPAPSADETAPATDSGVEA